MEFVQPEVSQDEVNALRWLVVARDLTYPDLPTLFQLEAELWSCRINST